MTAAPLRTVRLDLAEHNTVLAGEDRYFVFHSPAGTALVLDRCPHRGGPLSLGAVEPGHRRLICPWHHTRVSCAALRRRAVPAVRTGQRMMAYLPAAEPVRVTRRRVLANDPPDPEARRPLFDSTALEVWT
jgi:hypothetical protein